MIIECKLEIISSGLLPANLRAKLEQENINNFCARLTSLNVFCINLHSVLKHKGLKPKVLIALKKGVIREF